MNIILLWVLLITFIAGVMGTGLGGVISSFFKEDSKKTVSLLLSFAAGVMLSVVCFDLILDALFPTDTLIPHNLYIVLIGIIIGYAVIALLNYIIDRKTNLEVEHIDTDHPKTADNLDELTHANHFHAHKKRNSKLFTAGLIMAAAIALHNMPEGMVIGASYAGKTANDIWSSSSLLIAIVIGLHNIPEGMAVAVPLIAGGMSKKKAIFITASSGFPTVIGALIGFLLGSMGEIWYTLSLSFASGAMLYVVFGELLPESILMWRSKAPSLAIMVGMLSGLLIIFH